MDKVQTIENPADLLTKSVSAETADLHMTRLGMRWLSGRASTAPELSRGDQWEADAETCTRQHTTPRLALFTPMKVVEALRVPPQWEV